MTSGRYHLGSPPSTWTQGGRTISVHPGPLRALYKDTVYGSSWYELQHHEVSPLAISFATARLYFRNPLVARRRRCPCPPDREILYIVAAGFCRARKDAEAAPCPCAERPRRLDRGSIQRQRSRQPAVRAISLEGRGVPLSHSFSYRTSNTFF